MSSAAAPLLALAGLGAWLPGCAADFRPGSLADGGSNRRQLGCLEVAFDLYRDRLESASSILVRVRLGNRCRAPVAVDLARLAVTLVDRAGQPRRLRLSDPRGEVRAVAIEPRGQGEETLRFRASLGDFLPARLCLDVASLSAAPPSWPEPVCLPFAEEGS